jgi:hypothetical protein
MHKDWVLYVLCQLMHFINQHLYEDNKCEYIVGPFLQLLQIEHQMCYSATLIMYSCLRISFPFFFIFFFFFFFLGGVDHNNGYLFRFFNCRGFGNIIYLFYKFLCQRATTRLYLIDDGIIQLQGLLEMVKLLVIFIFFVDMCCKV